MKRTLPTVARIVVSLAALLGLKPCMNAVADTGTAQSVQADIQAAERGPADHVLTALDQLAMRYRQKGDAVDLAVVLEAAGGWAQDHGKYREALKYESEAVALLRSREDHAGEARLNSALGLAHSSLFEYAESIKCYSDSLDQFTALRMLKEVGSTETDLGTAYLKSGDPESALTYYRKAQATYEQLQMAVEVAGSRMGEGNADVELHRIDEALEQYNAALKTYSDLKLTKQIAEVQVGLGIAYYTLGRFDEALALHQEALSLFYSLHDQAGVARERANMGNTYCRMNNGSAALESFQAAAKDYAAMGDRETVAKMHDGMGLAYSSMGRLKMAIDEVNLAVDINRQIKSEAGVAREEINLGYLYDELGQDNLALQADEKALSYFGRQGKDLHAIATIDGNMGLAYSGLGKDTEALKFELKALDEYQQLKDLPSVTRMQGDISVLYMNRRMNAEAVTYGELALATYDKYRLRHEAAKMRGNLGDVLCLQKKIPEAAAMYQKALAAFQSYGDRTSEAWILDGLGEALVDNSQVRPGILADKLAVERFQSLRQDLTGLDRGALKAFQDRVAPTYRRLAGELLDSGRLTEAQQVLDLLKDSELSHFRDGKVRNMSVPYNLFERQCKAKYEALAAQMLSAQHDVDEMASLVRQKKTPSPDQLLRNTKAQEQIAQGDVEVLNWVRECVRILNEPSAINARAADADANTEGLRKSLRRLPLPTAAIYTLVYGNHISAILLLPGSSKLIAGPTITISNLRPKIGQFQAALNDPSADPRPSGAEFYDVLLRGFQKQLATNGIKAIAWSLDGPLRYLPMAALYDANKREYLVQQYATCVLIPAIRDRFALPAGRIKRAIGFGLTKPEVVGGETFGKLTAVTREMDELKRDFSARVFLDASFTRKNIRQTLAEKPDLLHLGTHFELRPGSADSSFMVLGDGSAYTVTEMNDELVKTHLLASTDLLVLSACDTASSLDTKADGAETESLARMALDGGAGSVIATLWPVQDSSTSTLMGKFYALRKVGVRKILALRQAQLVLLTGKPNPSPTRGSHSVKAPTTGLLPFKKDPKLPFAHPYYWAPFVLSGNAN